jgi:hypothetical protein
MADVLLRVDRIEFVIVVECLVEHDLVDDLAAILGHGVSVFTFSWGALALCPWDIGIGTGTSPAAAKAMHKKLNTTIKELNKKLKEAKKAISQSKKLLAK